MAEAPTDTPRLFALLFSFIYKPYNFTLVNGYIQGVTIQPRFAPAMFKVFFWVFACIAIATAGAVSHMWYSLKPQNVSIHLVYSILWIFYFRKKKVEWALTVALLVSFLCIGLLSGPSINYVFKVQQRHVIRFWAAGLLLFVYQILSLKGYSTRTLFNLSHLISPLFIIYIFLSNLFFGCLYIHGWHVPTNLVSSLAIIWSIPAIWFLLEWRMKDCLFRNFGWVLGHVHFLTFVGWLFCYPYHKLLGIYVYLLMVQLNIDLFTCDVIHMAVNQDVSISSMEMAVLFFTEFLARSTCNLWFGGSLVFRHIYLLWDVYLAYYWTMVFECLMNFFLRTIPEVGIVICQKISNYTPKVLEFLKRLGVNGRELWNVIGRVSRAYWMDAEA